MRFTLRRHLRLALREYANQWHIDESEIPEVSFSNNLVVIASGMADAKHEKAIENRLIPDVELTSRKLEELTTGELGEMAGVIYFLRDHWYRRYLRTRSFGAPDEYDLKVGSIEISIKTFDSRLYSKPKVWMLVKQDTFRKRVYPYYISCQRTAHDKIRILGFIERADLEKCPELTPEYCVEHFGRVYSWCHNNIGVPKLEMLTPIAELKKILQP